MTLASRPASPGTNVPSRNQSAPLELYDLSVYRGTAADSHPFRSPWSGEVRTAYSQQTPRSRIGRTPHVLRPDLRRDRDPARGRLLRPAEPSAPRGRVAPAPRQRRGVAHAQGQLRPAGTQAPSSPVVPRSTQAALTRWVRRL